MDECKPLCLGGAPPTPAEAREMDTRGLAAKLSDLKDENARLQQQAGAYTRSHFSST